MAKPSQNPLPPHLTLFQALEEALLETESPTFIMGNTHYIDRVADMLKQLNFENPAAQEALAKTLNDRVVKLLLIIANKTNDDIGRKSSACAISIISFESTPAAELFVQEGAMQALLKMAQEAESDEVKTFICNTITSLANIAGTTEFFLQEGFVGELMKMAREAKTDKLRSAIATTILLIIQRHPTTAELFVREGVVGESMKMARETENDYLRNMIATTIYSTIQYHPAAAELFVREGVVGELMKMAREAKTDELRSIIAIAIICCIQNHSAAAELFLLEGVVGELMKMAREAKTDKLRSIIAKTTTSCIQSHPAAAELFLLEGVVGELVKMAREANSDEVKTFICNTITSFANIAGAMEFLLQEEVVARELVKMAREAKTDKLRSAIATTILLIIQRHPTTAELFVREGAAEELVNMIAQAGADDAQKAILSTMEILFLAIKGHEKAAEFFVRKDFMRMLLPIALTVQSIENSSTLSNIGSAICTIARTGNKEFFQKLDPSAINALMLQLQIIALRTQDRECKENVLTAISLLFKKTSEPQRQAFLRTESLLNFLIEMVARDVDEDTVDKAIKTLNKIFSQNEAVKLIITEITSGRTLIKTELAKLDQSIAAYMATGDKEEPVAIRRLVERFLSDNQRARGGITNLLKSACPALEALYANPKYLEWANELAKKSVRFCFNQPAAGLVEIATLIEAAEAKTMMEKIEAAKVTLIFTRAISFVMLMGEKIPVRDNAEAVNLLMSKIHAQLLEQKLIKKPWVGVPDSTPPFDKTSQEHLEREIGNFMKIACQILQENPHTTLDEILTEVEYGPIFATITRPHLLVPVEAEFKRELDELQFAACELSDNKSMEETLKDERFKNDAEREDFKRKYEGKDLEALNEMFKLAENRLKMPREAIAEASRLCHEALEAEISATATPAAASAAEPSTRTIMRAAPARTSPLPETPSRAP